MHIKNRTLYIRFLDIFSAYFSDAAGCLVRELAMPKSWRKKNMVLTQQLQNSFFWR